VLDFSAISNQSRMGRILRAPLDVMPKCIEVHILQGPLRGKRWIVGSSNDGCWLGTYELSKVRRVTTFVKPGLTPGVGGAATDARDQIARTSPAFDIRAKALTLHPKSSFYSVSQEWLSRFWVVIPQGLKPFVFLHFSTRLKSCPDTMRLFETSSDSFIRDCFFKQQDVCAKSIR
jgi:hypothetical protein